MVVFSGGAAKGADAVFQDARDIRDGGGNGSIIGRNAFQRPREDALAMLDRLVRIYKGEEWTDFRHCEQSEAMQCGADARWIARRSAPRNDGA